ncbi:hypothetical protein EC844_1072 [Acinetobacter calcoaceticus]|uniref:Uncharacterized protein n=1 Tax=Acinetobacter calcoaceticus TaxID=471 RepID=A0A4V6NJD1_ACICA|nr:hypothetical protein EC844_1072 [Acinetobacter calcoaceticus]
MPSYADLVQLDSPNRDSDERLAQLTKTLSQSTYTPPSGNNTYSVRVRAASTQSSNNNDKLDDIKIHPNDYNRYGLKPLYSSSTIYYDPNQKEYYERHKFNNNIVMIRYTDQNHATFYDLDAKNMRESAWRLNCDIDHTTDEIICAIEKSKLMLIKGSDLGFLLTVSQDFDNLKDNEYQFLKIDENPVAQTKLIFSGNTALKIVNQMKVGTYAYTRFTEYAGTYEETLSLYGFSAAYDTMNLMYAGLSH